MSSNNRCQPTCKCKPPQNSPSNLAGVKERLAKVLLQEKVHCSYRGLFGVVRVLYLCHICKLRLVGGAEQLAKKIFEVRGARRAVDHEYHRNLDLQGVATRAVERWVPRAHVRGPMHILIKATLCSASFTAQLRRACDVSYTAEMSATHKLIQTPVGSLFLPAVATTRCVAS